MSLSLSNVSADASVTTYNVNTSHPKNETAADAINIGNLDEESATISVSDQGTAASGAVSATFTALDGTTSLSQSFQNFVDEVSTRFQLYDNQGNVIADSQGTPAQEAAFQEWQAGNLELSAGTYTAIATPPTGAGAPSLTIASQEQQGTSLHVSSSLTGSDPSEFYNFSFSGANLKLDFDAGGQTPSTRVQIYNSSGNLVADSEGNPFLKANYQAITSGPGLAATSGNYSIEVSYAGNVDTQPTIPYSFQLYSGSSYAVVYNTKVAAQPTDNTATGSVTPTSDAQLFSANRFNKINATAETAIEIGWIQENKSSLDVLSQLTSADSNDFFTFTLQQGNNLKFGFNTKSTPDPSALRVQILNSTGTQVLADNDGTPAQQTAYKELTTTNGLKAAPGTYVVKVSYAQGAPRTPASYEFGIYSGTGYAAEYKTIASAQTFGNALASGTLAGTSPATAIASYLTAQSNGDTTSSLAAALQAFI